MAASQNANPRGAAIPFITLAALACASLASSGLATEPSTPPKPKPDPHGREQPCIKRTEEGWRAYSMDQVARSADKKRGVSHDRVEFERNRIVHPVDVFVGYAPAPNTVDEYCMRFEVHNRGEVQIDDLRWPYVGMRFSTLPPEGDPFSRKAKGTITDSDPPPRFHDSELVAFRDNRKSVRGYMSQEVSAKPPTPPQKATLSTMSYSFAHLNKAISGPVLEYAAGDPDVTLPESFSGVEIPAATFEEKRIVRWLEAEGAVVVAESSLKRGDGEVVTTLRLSLEGREDSIYAPFFFAMESLEAGENGQVNETEFAESYPSMMLAARETRNKQITYLGDGEEIVIENRFSTGDDGFRVFAVVDHPIGIRNEGGVDCFMAPAFAPVPLGFSLDDCAE